jgi:hypothetical protein
MLNILTLEIEVNGSLLKKKINLKSEELIAI